MRADKRINTLMRLKHFITEVSRHACIVKLIHAGKHTCLHLQAPRYRIWQVQYPEVHRVETWGSSHEAYLRSSRAAEPKSILCLKLSYLQKPFFCPFTLYITLVVAQDLVGKESRGSLLEFFSFLW